jgi:hypothetical protein
MMRRARLSHALLLLALSVWSVGCDRVDQVMASINKVTDSLNLKGGAPVGCMFIGIDVSQSFIRGRYWDDSINFLATYIYAHLKGTNGLAIPQALFVGTIGGVRADEPKTFFPIQTFEHSSVAEIRAKLQKLFPRDKDNPITDFNAFFDQISILVQAKKLILKPISIVLISDGKPDIPGKVGDELFRAITVKPLEKLSRNITIRLIYTDAAVGQKWLTMVPRRRVKFWTQDGLVMVSWKDPKIMLAGRSIDDQTRLFRWVKDNVDFPARSIRVD